MIQTTSDHLSIARHVAGKYSRPNKFITWYCDKRHYTGKWLTAPWCAIFQSWVAHEAGLAGQVGEFASCPSWVTWFRGKGRWGTTPRVGALVFFDWNADGVADHVGLVSAVGPKAIKSIEGNTTVGGTPNWVHEQTRKRSLVLGYGYPKYLDEAVQPAETVYTVRKGDTLSSIAKTYETTWQKVWAVNKAAIVSPSLIKPGQKLRIP